MNTVLTQTEKDRQEAAEAVYSIPHLLGISTETAVSACHSYGLTALKKPLREMQKSGEITWEVPFHIAVNASQTNTPEKYVKACFIGTTQFTENIKNILNKKGEYYGRN